MRKLILYIVIAVCGFRCFNVLNYRYAEELKAPIFRTRFTKNRFVKLYDIHVSCIDYEYDGSNLYKIKYDLNSIDVNSFHQLRTGSVVDIEYCDKRHTYIIHDGEEKYIIRLKI